MVRTDPQFSPQAALLRRMQGVTVVFGVFLGRKHPPSSSDAQAVGDQRPRFFLQKAFVVHTLLADAVLLAVPVSFVHWSHEAPGVRPYSERRPVDDAECPYDSTPDHGCLAVGDDDK